ncbi:MAG: IclR family transcriptional regulator [Armatimonadota bacterium]|nr:IclR family transcriptional regulator [Armatimonadota bacterium]MDR7443693.1 IclR family transcriptional regulator [Armatimonadota bacterium]MDR7569890.1 IclR family transcriptional regulator [Armatimonadota bacterium]MDR7613779.1 IclR family transcriptional regulator [Armatimonadota bacterium]
MSSPERTVRSLLRGLQVLEILARDPELSLTEIARRAHLPFSTTHRLLETLCRRGFVTQPEASGRYRLGLKAFEVGIAFLASHRLPEVARPVMVDLVKHLNETANLAVRDGREAVYVLQVESPRMLRLFAHPGARHPLYCTGVGKVLLAWEPEPEVRSLLGSGPLPRYTPRTLTDPEAVLQELRAVRARGYAVDREERETGVRCVAAPVRDATGRVVAALSVSAPATRLPYRRIPEVAGATLAAASRISRLLGFSETPKGDGRGLQVFQEDGAVRPAPSDRRSAGRGRRRRREEPE